MLNPTSPTQPNPNQDTADEINNSNKDVSMVDVSKAEGDHEGHAPPIRRKSTMILTDDIDLDRMNIDNGEPQHNDDKMNIDPSSTNLQQHQQQQPPQQPAQQQQPGAIPNAPQQQPQPPAPEAAVAVPVDIKWVQGGQKVYVTGSFTGWRKMIGLVKQPDNNFLITLGLPVGTHRFRFVVDNELRFSDFLPTATDQTGNFVNYIEITPENVQQHLLQQEGGAQQHQEPAQEQLDHNLQPGANEQQPPSGGRRLSVGGRSRSNSMWGLTNDDDDMGNGYSRYYDDESTALDAKKYNYINDIPPIFTDPKVMEQYYVAIDKQSRSNNGQQQAWLHPPQLPPHLESVILNNFNNNNENNSGALPIPNHVVLNHLATTSIKHNTLAVASIVRYKRKYLTQVLYAPLQPAPPPPQPQDEQQPQPPQQQQV
ncbi:SNF1 protein kinase subunit beta-3 [Candida viswanathii]|uniref:SNF1 protein kinase subunit beta-3 n=1 Tax=Candida viswanathii TaxID=5486 RepID=A0A367XLS9_9ASCO|nr:SNF1 protein kinase subunit beta-3 [Candida viswanathii]